MQSGGTSFPGQLVPVGAPRVIRLGLVSLGLVSRGPSRGPSFVGFSFLVILVQPCPQHLCRGSTCCHDNNP